MSQGPGDFNVHQEVLDSALRLLALRRQALRVADTKGSGVSIVASGGDLTRWTMRAARTWTSLLATTPVMSVAALARTVSNNRELTQRGLKMKSVFDFGGAESPAWRLLAAEPDADEIYFASFAPLLMRIVDGRHVLVPGPSETPSILRMSTPPALEAALAHWDTLFAHAVPCGAVNDARQPPRLPTRQTLILEQLRRGRTDAHIAANLSVSTRTIQSEVARLMARYGVASRFALGYAYAAWCARREGPLRASEVPERPVKDCGNTQEPSARRKQS